ncbi:MAG: hypothetical protein PHU95_06045, partial [Candidatus Thermoplasmatota archaeon]|nr:hypothetical protein [Candidatus Thermoplasmatota archaeon]
AMVAESDLIVTMGCLDNCPLTPQEKTIEWQIEDPAGQSLEKFREVRDNLKRRVKQLLGQMVT